MQNLCMREWQIFHACPVILILNTSFQFLVVRKVIVIIITVTATAAMVTATVATVTATVATVTATVAMVTAMVGNSKRISVQKSGSAAGRDSTASGTTTRRKRRSAACCHRFGSRFVSCSICF